MTFTNSANIGQQLPENEEEHWGMESVALDTQSQQTMSA